MYWEEIIFWVIIAICIPLLLIVVGVTVWYYCYAKPLEEKILQKLEQEEEPQESEITSSDEQPEILYTVIENQ